MADPNIRIKRSAIPGKQPTADQLPLGELALNTNDGKLFASKNAGIGTTVFAVNPWSVGTGTDSYNVHFTAGNVGVGSTIPTSKLDVEGDINVSGVITASQFIGGGVGVGIQSGGTVLGYGITTLNFIGAGNTFSVSGTTVDISIAAGSGGGGTGISSVIIQKDGTNIGTGSSTINFTGTGIQTVTSSPSGITTVRVELQGNLDGGLPDSNYGGIEAIEGGGI